MSQEPRIKIEDVASDYHDFYRKLSSGKLPMPCWIEFGDGGYKVTAENHKAVSLGMLLEMEARAHFEG